MNVLIVSSSEGIATGLLRCLSLHDVRASIMNVWHSSKSSRLSRHCHRYSSCELSENPEKIKELVAAINEECAKYNIDLVLAAGILGTCVLAKIKNELKCPHVFPMPSVKQIQLLHNKWLFHNFLVEHGLPSPQTVLISDRSDLDNLKIGFPAILKPLSLGNSEGVLKVNSREEIERYLDAGTKALLLPVLIQEFAPGSDVVLGVLAKDGELIAWTLHEKKQHFIRFFKHDRIVELARKIVAAIKYNGVGNFDFRYEESTGKVAVLECNPRFWASAPISVYFGVDFVNLGMLTAQGKALPADCKRSVEVDTDVPYPTPRRFITGLILGRYKYEGKRKDVAWRALFDPFPTIKEIIWDKLKLLNIYDSILMEKMFEEDAGAS